MSLYVANTSRCTLDFTFNVRGIPRHFKVTIPPFSQHSIYPDGTKDDHADIVGQNKRYGLVAVSDIDRTKTFIGMCYQFDRPIQQDKMLKVAPHNDGVRLAEAQESRKIAAIAMDDALSRAAQETGEKFQGVEIEIEEQEQKGSDVQIKETIAVDNPSRGRGRPRKNP